MNNKKREVRDSEFFWSDKGVIRWFRKQFPKKHYRNLRSIYLALCEMDSDFHEGQEIKSFRKTLSTYSGRDIRTVNIYYRVLREVGLVNDIQIRGDGGYFLGSKMVLYSWHVDDQGAYYLENTKKVDRMIEGNYSEEEQKELDTPSTIVTESELLTREIDIDDTVKEDVSNHYITRADRLKTIIASHVKVNKRVSMVSWAKTIKLLHKRDDVSIKRIDAVLDWYENNIGGKFVPQAYSAQSFRDKFINLEQAVARDDSSNTTTSPKVIDTKYDKVKTRVMKVESQGMGLHA